MLGLHTTLSNNTHVLRKHLPEVRQLSYNLRPLSHGFLLPSKDDRNFIYWLLYKDTYSFPFGCLVLAVPPSARDEETLTDSLLLYIMSCNRSCGSCQLRYVQ